MSNDTIKLTAENYKSGILIDDQLMAGISDDPSQPGQFLAYVIDHQKGETLGSLSFANVFDAIRELKAIPREWEFTKVGGCGGCSGASGGEAGKCGGKRCNKAKTDESECAPC